MNRIVIRRIAGRIDPMYVVDIDGVQLPGWFQSREKATAAAKAHLARGRNA